MFCELRELLPVALSLPFGSASVRHYLPSAHSVSTERNNSSPDISGQSLNVTSLKLPIGCSHLWDGGSQVAGGGTVFPFRNKKDKPERPQAAAGAGWALRPTRHPSHRRRRKPSCVDSPENGGLAILASRIAEGCARRAPSARRFLSTSSIFACFQLYQASWPHWPFCRVHIVVTRFCLVTSQS